MHNFALEAAYSLGFNRTIRHFDNDGFQGKLTHLVDGVRVELTVEQMAAVEVEAQILEDNWVDPAVPL